MFTIVVTGRNDDYGGGFAARLFTAVRYNSEALRRHGVAHEYLFVEWNPVPATPWLADAFVRRFPNARAVVVPPAIHQAYSLNPHMAFHELMAVNVGIRRARTPWIVVNTADVLLGDDTIEWMAGADRSDAVLYRAERVELPPTATPGDLPGARRDATKVEPCRYTGGGDFCCASAGLWNRLRGYDESVRFSSRAKDWKLFLSAASYGVSIEFVGHVYHIGHASGFQMTPAQERDTARAHFGGIWDFEFIPSTTNTPAWGLEGVGARSHDGDARISVLDATAYTPTPAERAEAAALQEWLTHDEACPDIFSATLLHAICAAQRHHRALTVRVNHAREAVAVARMAPVARLFGVCIRCNWTWPQLTSPMPQPMLPEPRQHDCDDWILERAAAGWQVRDAAGERAGAVLPVRLPVRRPKFNPFMVRRLLRAWLLVQELEPASVALFGAGGHTFDLLAWGVPDSVPLTAVVVSGTGGGDIDGVPIRSLADVAADEIDTLIVSSVTYESEMLQRARDAGVRRVVTLYRDWPVEELARAGAQPR